MFNDNDVLDRHKKDITCDLCTKRVWFWQKAIRRVVRIKDDIWTEYYHIKCLEKIGIIIRVRKLKAGKFDNKDDNEPSTNIVH